MFPLGDVGIDICEVSVLSVSRPDGPIYGVWIRSSSPESSMGNIHEPWSLAVNKHEQYGLYFEFQKDPASFIIC